jgi:hypothetical protein
MTLISPSTNRWVKRCPNCRLDRGAVAVEMDVAGRDAEGAIGAGR